MVDGIRVGIRVATVAAIIAIAVGVYALFNSINIPAADTAGIIQAVGVGRAVLHHWAPEVEWCVTAIIGLYFVKWSIFFLRYAVMGFKWLLVIWR